MKVKDYKYLIDLLSEKHLQVKTKKEMEYIMSLKAELRQKMYDAMDNE